MHLTLRLCVYNYRRAYLCHKIPHRFRGKQGKVIPPQYIDLLRMRYDFEREERNMIILQQPYLTAEQSHGHMKNIKVPKDYKVFSNQINNAKFRKDITIEDRLSHLNITNAWE